jgi:undecaprenyl diphosphate synthase
MNKFSEINHLAIIMDGNARWSKREGLPIAEGHRRGAENAKQMLSIIAELGVSYLTLFAFSSENWKRADEEILYLLELLSYYLQSEEFDLNKNGIRVKIIGKLDRLDHKLQAGISKIIEATKHNNRMTLCIAFSYGSIQEITDACQKIIDSGVKSITPEKFRNYLYDPEMPDVDLLIRTSGVVRISNFLLWQAAYAELFFSKKYWPEFTREDLIEAINDYGARKRNFGSRDSDAI